MTDNSADPGKPGGSGKKPRTPPSTARVLLWAVAGAIGVYWLGSGIIGLISGGS